MSAYATPDPDEIRFRRLFGEDLSAVPPPAPPQRVPVHSLPPSEVEDTLAIAEALAGAADDPRTLRDLRDCVQAAARQLQAILAAGRQEWETQRADLAREQAREREARGRQWARLADRAGELDRREAQLVEWDQRRRDRTAASWRLLRFSAAWGILIFTLGFLCGVLAR